MKTLNSISEIIKAADGKKAYIRWSRGPALDRKQGKSLAYGTQSEAGISVQNLRSDDIELLARMLQEYQFCRGKDSRIYCWIMTADRNGTGADDEPTVDASTIVEIGKVSDTLIDKCTSYSMEYWRWARTGYRNAEIEAEVKRLFSEIG